MDNKKKEMINKKKDLGKEIAKLKNYFNDTYHN